MFVVLIHLDWKEITMVRGCDLTYTILLFYLPNKDKNVYVHKNETKHKMYKCEANIRQYRCKYINNYRYKYFFISYMYILYSILSMHVV